MAGQKRISTALRIIGVGLALVVIGLKHGGWFSAHRQAEAPAVVATTDPAPAAAAHWQLGRLDLRACALTDAASGQSVAAWCGTLAVPEDPARVGGRLLHLRLAVIRSDAQSAAADIVTVLAGGPGQAATEVWPGLAAGMQGLLHHRHVLLVDQRGTGGSQPLNCHDDTAANPALQAGDPVALQAAATQCADALSRRADLRMYTTTMAVRDLEQVRQALGAPALDLIGISYGTRVAQHYAATYPAAVRSVVLDGVVPNTLALGQTHAANLDAALQAQSRRCQADAGCRQRFNDPYASLRQLQRQLRQQPLPVTLRDPHRYTLEHKSLDAETLAVVARMFAYNPATMAVLPLAVDAAAHGDGAPLMAQAQLLTAALGDSMSAGMGYSVSCTEDVDLLQVRPQDQDTLLGNRFVTSLQAICAGWPKGTRPPDFHQAFHTDAPVLLLSGQYDPVTPPAYAQSVAAGLHHARSLVLAGQGHHVMLAGCMPRLVSRFIEHADVAAIDDSCLRSLRAPAFFTSFNGVTP